MRASKEKNESKNKARVPSDIEAFLAKGGEIQVCPIIVRDRKAIMDQGEFEKNKKQQRVQREQRIQRGLANVIN